MFAAPVLEITVTTPVDDGIVLLCTSANRCIDHSWWRCCHWQHAYRLALTARHALCSHSTQSVVDDVKCPNTARAIFEN